MIQRKRHVDALLKRLRAFPVVAILGPRQIGKTTLAHQVGRAYKGRTHRLDLENPSDLGRLMEDPVLVLDGMRGLVVIDEVQRRPDLFPILRVLADRRPRRARFLVLGSASPDLLRQSSETLAGRINYYRLGGLGLDEVGQARLDRRWLRGGFPEAWLARSNSGAFLWLESFVQTFLERDLPGLWYPHPRTDPAPLLDHAGSLAWSSVELIGVRSLLRRGGYDHTQVSRHSDRRARGPPTATVAREHCQAAGQGTQDLSARFGCAARLAGHGRHAIAQRASQVGGIVGGIPARDDRRSPRSGRRANSLLGDSHGRRARFADYPRTQAHRVEIKRTTAPKVTASVRTALRDLDLAEVIVVHAGRESYPLGANVRGVAAARLDEDLDL